MNRQLILILLGLTLAGTVSAASPTATPSATATAKPNQIDDLKERLATKVAQLRQTQRKAIDGSIKVVSVSTITVETKTSDIKIELTDEIKVFQTIKGKRTTLTTENLEKGDHVVVFGEYDTGLELLRAKVIVIYDPLPLRVAGVVTQVDEEKFTVTIKTKEELSYVVDIEKTTSMMAFDNQNGVVKGGFSKVAAGNIVHLTGTAVPKQENRVSAIRFLNIGNVTGATPTPTPTQEATPSATVKSSPTATPKATPKVTATPTP